ncbi:hypothetical protein FN846DRAFT_896593 [Sphaerosporella brunnea]|uniref:Uncharacterized protein n=1 Tax=Sphaerosporella brunnea TaxID=1250544 RepID=A0A5J5EBX4_9PEZI|nr:hypothetical protein FN846DRAFT_896593 [Sphaerosporella brunnea]
MLINHFGLCIPLPPDEFQRLVKEKPELCTCCSPSAFTVWLTGPVEFVYRSVDWIEQHADPRVQNYVRFWTQWWIWNSGHEKPLPLFADRVYAHVWAFVESNADKPVMDAHQVGANYNLARAGLDELSSSQANQLCIDGSGLEPEWKTWPEPAPKFDEPRPAELQGLKMVMKCALVQPVTVDMNSWVCPQDSCRKKGIGKCQSYSAYWNHWRDTHGYHLHCPFCTGEPEERPVCVNKSTFKKHCMTVSHPWNDDINNYLMQKWTHANAGPAWLASVGSDHWRCR